MQPFVRTTYKCEPTFLGVNVIRDRQCFDGDNFERDISGIQLAGTEIGNPQRMTVSTNK